MEFPCSVQYPHQRRIHRAVCLSAAGCVLTAGSVGNQVDDKAGRMSKSQNELHYVQINPGAWCLLQAGCGIHCIFHCNKNRAIQYIPRNMHTVLLCFALLWLCNRSQWIHMKYLSIFIRVALLALGQSLDCHSAREVSLMDIGKSVNV